MVDTKITEELSHLIAKRLAKAFAVDCQRLIGKLPDEPELLTRVCKIAVDTAGFSMAWVGYPNNDPNKSIIPIAFCGNRQDVRYLLTKRRSWSTDCAFAQGPIATTIREGKPFVSTNITADPLAQPWMPEAIELGYHSIVLLPLLDEGKTLGFIGLYSRAIRWFDSVEIVILQETVHLLATEIVRLRKLDETEKIKTATMKIALSIATKSGHTFFEQFIRNVSSTFMADAGIIAYICQHDPHYAESLVAIVDGMAIENFRYKIVDSPCQELLSQRDCVINENVVKQFPQSSQLGMVGAESYVGTQLYNGDGYVMGFIYLLFRVPLKQSGHIRSTLHIFAHTASSELAKLTAS